MKWSAEERRSIAEKLDGMERAIVYFYRLLLGLVIAAILGAVVFVVIDRPWGSGHQGEWFYFSIAVLLALGWAVGQFISVGRRLPRRPSMQIRSEGKADQRAWTFRLEWGSLGKREVSAANADERVASFSRSFHVPLASLPSEVLPDDAALRCVKGELAKGVDLDDACRTVQPAYSDWGKFEQQAYRMYVTTWLDERRPADADDGACAHAFDA